MASPKSDAARHLKNARRLYMQYEAVRLARHPKRKLIRRMYDVRLKLEAEFLRIFREISDDMYSRIPQDDAIAQTMTRWAVLSSKKSWGVRKADDTTPPDLAEVEAMLLQHADNVQTFEDGAVALYLGFVAEAANISGAHALEYLGLGKTFAWAHPRAMARDTFSVRGSKIIQDMYGNHVHDLAKIIIDATDPRHPKTLDEVKSEIRSTWEALNPAQVERIARTETAAVWTQTQAEAYVANGIQAFETLIATGPSIGVEVEDPCDECVDLAASGPFEATDDLPPWHPNCRCEAIPVTEDPELYAETDGVWLPPDEPFTGVGDEAPLDAAPEPGPSAEYEDASTRVDDAAAADAAAQDDVEAARGPSVADRLDGIRRRL